MKKLLFILLLLPIFTFAQTAKEYVEQADKTFKDIYKGAKRYDEAIALYMNYLIQAGLGWLF